MFTTTKLPDGEGRAAESARSPALAEPFSSSTLAEGERAEALRFLAERPLRGLLMSGTMRDNGVSSPLNRGKFWGFRDSTGRLAAVALIGHLTLFDAREAGALAAVAAVAANSPVPRLIFGEREQTRALWRRYREERPVEPQFARDELVLACDRACVFGAPLAGLRRATQQDAAPLMEAHAAMVREENGGDPLRADPDGFRRRTERRIAQGRVWVLFDAAGRLAFKTDVIVEEPHAYIEGVWVAPESRGRGIAARGVAQVCGEMLARAASVSLAVVETNLVARNLYRKLGFVKVERARAIFF